MLLPKTSFADDTGPLRPLRKTVMKPLAMSFVVDKANFLGLSNIYLTVNKDNINAIRTYEKLGFKNIDSLVTDIGNGFVMDDFKMQKELVKNLD